MAYQVECGTIITDTDAFGIFFKTLATVFKNDAKVIFDTNNEYHDIDQTLTLNLNQGNSYSGAWTWNAVNDNLKAPTDPHNKIIYQMHQYLDSDGSGTSPNCFSSTIGVERVKSATAWLRANGKIGIIGEFAGGANSQCKAAVTGLLQHLKTNSDVWTGALWWGGGGPWWGNYIFGFEPPSGTGYTYYDPTLLQFRP